MESITSKTQRLEIAESENLTCMLQPPKPGLEELKHDCREKIWEYLPSSQLYELVSSLKSNQFLREISLYELRLRSPLGLCQERSKFSSNRYGVFLLKDRFEVTALTISHRQRKGLKHSPIFELIQSANLLIGIDACHSVGFWADLILPLPTLTNISLTFAPGGYLDEANGLLSGWHSAERSDALRVFAREFQPFFTNLCHFGLLNWDFGESYCQIVEATLVRGLLQEMLQLRSLEIPLSFLGQISTRRSGDWLPLKSLALYSTAPRRQLGEFAAVVSLCPELDNFAYVCRNLADGLTCYELSSKLTQLLALPKLRKLSLDTGRGQPLQRLGEPANFAAGTVAPLTEMHVTFRQNDEFGVATPPSRDSVCESLFLFAHVGSLRTLRISLKAPRFVLGVQDQLRRMISQGASPIYLRHLKIEKIQSAQCGKPVAESHDRYLIDVLSGNFLATWIYLCPNLESIDASSICIHLSGYISGPRPDNGSGENGFWGIAAIVNAIRSSASIKYVKISAKLDSIAALKSELPGRCGVFDVVERSLDCGTMEGCVLDPDKYWQPVSLLVVGPKVNLNTFHLRILVDNN